MATRELNKKLTKMKAKWLKSYPNRKLSFAEDCKQFDLWKKFDVLSGKIYGFHNSNAKSSRKHAREYFRQTVA